MSLLNPIGIDTVTGQQKVYDPSIDTIGGLTNYVVVKQLSDLPTPVANVITLQDNYTYQFNGLVNIGANHLLCGVSNTIIGVDKSNDGIIYTSTGGAIRSTDRDLSIRNIVIVAASGSAFALTGSVGLTKQLEIAENIFSGCGSIGTILTGYSKVIFRGNLATGCAGGLSITSNNDDMFITDNVLEAFTGTPTIISIGTANYHTIIISRNMIETAAGQTAISVGTITFASGGIINGNAFEGVGTKLSGVNGGTTGWDIAFGSNVGIGGLQYVDVDVVSTADVTFANGAGTSVEGSTVRGYVYELAEYDQYATVIQAKATALITSVEATFQVGIRNLTSATLVGGLKTAVLPGTLGYVDGDYIAITPNRNYQVYYVKTANTGGNVATRFASKIKLKIY